MYAERCQLFLSLLLHAYMNERFTFSAFGCVMWPWIRPWKYEWEHDENDDPPSKWQREGEQTRKCFILMTWAEGSGKRGRYLQMELPLKLNDKYSAYNYRLLQSWTKDLVTLM